MNDIIEKKHRLSGKFLSRKDNEEVFDKIKTVQDLDNIAGYAVTFEGDRKPELISIAHGETAKDTLD